MFKSILSTATLLVSLTTIGQNRFSEGYLITNEGDTLQGEIATQKDAKNYEAAIFRNEGKIQTFTSNEIAGFGYTDDRVFISGIKEGVFVELLVDGKISLYKYEKQYHLKKDDDIKILEKKNHPANTLGYAEKKAVDNKWKGTIGYMISDCNRDLSQELLAITFIEKDITQIIISYNLCFSDHYFSPKANKKWTKLELGGTIGLNRTAIPELTILDDEASFDFSGGLLLNLSAPRVSERITFHSEILFVSASYESSFTNSIGTNSTRTFDYSFKFQKVSIPIALKYILPFKSLGIYAMTGVSGEFLLGSNFDEVETENRNGSIDQTFRNDFVDLSNTQIGIWGGLGVEKTFNELKFGLFARQSLLYNFFDQPAWEFINGNRSSLSIYLIKEIY